MNRLNNIWSNQTNPTNMFNPQQAQLFLLQQQLQQHLAQQEQREQPKFSSSFSVNNLLGQTQRTAPQQQQIAAVLTQQIAAAMVNNYRQQMSKLQRPSYPDSAFQQPKRLKVNDFDQSEINQLNTSTSSISSPSSSSSSALSLDFSGSNHQNQNESDLGINSSQLHDNISERNTPDLLSYSSSSSSSCSFSIKRSNENSIYSNGLMQCPICCMEISNLNDLRAHFNQELNEIIRYDQNLSNKKQDFASIKTTRQLKFEEIKENRLKRSERKSIQRLKKENIDTCKINQKSIKKREYDEIDCELSNGNKKSKRFKQQENNPDSECDDEIYDEMAANEEEENDEYINVVDNDDEDQDKILNDSDLNSQHKQHDHDNDSQENNLSNSKCLNCLQIFNNNALVSVTCWHVNCKTCWLKSIDENKNCPQCHTVTLPKHLKKIIL